MKASFNITQNKQNHIDSIIWDNKNIILSEFDGNVAAYFLSDLEITGENSLDTYFTDSQIELFENLDKNGQEEVWEDLTDWINTELNYYTEERIKNRE